MSSNFKNWVEDNEVSDSTLVTLEDYNSATSSRATGFKPNTVAYAKWVNTGLRQANLITTALMNVVNSRLVNFRSNTSAVETTLRNFFNNLSVQNATNSTNATYATYASSDTSKGTIEERLTNLGFSSGVGLASHGSGSCSLSKIGKYVLAKINISSINDYVSFRIPLDFRRITEGRFYLGTVRIDLNNVVNITYEANNELSVLGPSGSNVNITVGWEIK